MFKNIALALVAVASIGGATVAYADTDDNYSGYEDRDASSQLNQNTVQTRLERAGFTVAGVENWGNYIRAFVIDADGHQTQQFFDANTLAPIDNSQVNG